MNSIKKHFTTITNEQILLISTVSFFITIILFVIYVNRINIYGNFKIQVFEDGKNITDSLNIFGVSIFNREKELKRNCGSLLSDNYWYFKSLKIKPHSGKCMNSFRIIIKSDEILLDTVAFIKDTFVIDRLNYEDNYFNKLVNVGFFKNKRTRVFTNIIFLCFVFFYALILIRKNINFKTCTILCMILSGTAVFFYHFFVLEKIFLWSGYLLLFSASVLSIVLVNKFLSCEKKRKQNILLFFTGILLGILLSEAILRLIGMNISYFEKRFGYYESVYYQNRVRNDFSRTPKSEYSLKTSEFDYKRYSNSLGLSGDEPEYKNNPLDFLIIGLGDSFTEGDGAHADSTWLKFLERKIPDKDSSNFIWINAGLCGSDPFYEYKLLQDKLLVFNPDLVIINYGNELTDVIIRGGMERFESGKTAINYKIWEPIYAVSFICRLIVHNLFGYNDLLLSHSDYENEKQRAIKQLKESLLNFKELSEVFGFELLIVFHPMKKEIDNKKYDNESNCNDQLMRFANENGINYVDLLQYYTEVENISSVNSQKYYWKYDGHHNAAGYEKFANGVYW
ncbi:MAG: SGNH/GDSL hydrolase family protein, partial [Bacteroidales bacterium]|nr:SGNH/GDSL hydrolase family protein [Bacteroidales bacterium]